MALSVRAVLALEITPTAVGNGNSDFAVARPFRIYDCGVLCTITDGGGAATAQLLRQALGAGAFNAITNAMACTTASTVARTTTVTVAERDLVATDVLRLALTGGTGNGLLGTQSASMVVRVLPQAIAGN